MDTGLVIFDLDGTLLNTIGDLAVACNAVLAMRGLPQHTYDEYCHFVGNGIMRLVERALPEELRTPYTVAAVRAGLGAAQPFDILPAVWVTSALSVATGILAAKLLSRLWRS